MRRMVALLLSVVVLASCDAAAPTPHATPVADISFRVRLAQAVNQLNDYWSLAFQSVSRGSPYELLPPERVRSYLPGEAPPLGTGDRCRATPEEGVGNAWYCDHHIAYDETFLYDLRQRAGLFAPLVVLAHEWGHHIQELSGLDAQHDIQGELQADCYSGAWARHLAGLDLITVDDIRTGALTLRQISDDRDRGLPAPQWFEPGAHGRGTERAQAFALGLISENAGACGELEQFRRLERVELGGGVSLEVMQGVRAHRTEQGVAVLDFEGRGIPTVVEARFDPALAGLRVDHFVDTGLGQFLGANHRIIEWERGEYAGAETLTAFYEQTASGQDGPTTYFGMIIVALSSDGGVVFDAYERGSAPTEATGWARVRTVMIATQAGLGVPGGAQ